MDLRISDDATELLQDRGGVAAIDLVAPVG
jgi:hypothetical protein